MPDHYDQTPYIFETMCLFRNQDGWGVSALSKHLTRLEHGVRSFLRAEYPEGLESFVVSPCFGASLRESVLRACRRIILQKCNCEELSAGEVYRLRVCVAIDRECGPLLDNLHVTIQDLTFESTWFGRSLRTSKLPQDYAVRVIPFSGTRILPHIKSSYTDVSRTAREYAVSHDCYESLLVDSDGILREGAWTNVFWKTKEGEWKTTATGILEGTACATLLDLFAESIGNGELTAPPLRRVNEPLRAVVDSASSMLLTNALIGVLPVCGIVLGDDDVTTLDIPSEWELLSVKFRERIISQFELLAQ